MVINLEFIDLNLEIMCIYNKQYQSCWIWLLDMLFYMCERCYLLECYCWRVEMVRHIATTTCVIVGHVIIYMLMAKSTVFWRLFLLDYVICCMGSLSLSCHYVNLWSMFKRLACGMYYATIGRHTCCKMILALVHYANLCTYSYN